jgi:hypothetical protein
LANPYGKNYINIVEEQLMQTPAIATITKMMEKLPEANQQLVVEHMREYINTFKDEERWDNSFKASQNSLIAAAKKAKKEIASGKSKPLDFRKL